MAVYNPRLGEYRGPAPSGASEQLAIREALSPPSGALKPAGIGIADALIRPVGEAFLRAGGQVMKSQRPSGGCLVWRGPIPVPGGDWRECLFDYAVYSAIGLVILAGIALVVFGVSGQTIAGRVQRAAKEVIS